MKLSTSKVIATLSVLTLLTACNGGFQTLSSVTGGGNSGQDTGGGTTTPTQPTAYDKLDMQGYVSGGAYDNNFAVDIDKENNALLVNLPIPAGPFTDVNIEIPDRSEEHTSELQSH